MESLSQVLSTIADAKSVIGIGAGSFAVLSAFGATPRVGLLRCLVLSWRGLLKKTYPLSVREKDVISLKEELNSLMNGQYIVVTGGKGVGKSCFIDTCLNRQMGVVKISVRISFHFILFLDLFL